MFIMRVCAHFKVTSSYNTAVKVCVCVCDRACRLIIRVSRMNVAALALITYLWIRLISKPTAERHTVKEAGGVEKR